MTPITRRRGALSAILLCALLAATTQLAAAGGRSWKYGYAGDYKGDWGRVRDYVAHDDYSRCSKWGWSKRVDILKLVVRDRCYDELEDRCCAKGKFDYHNWCFARSFGYKDVDIRRGGCDQPSAEVGDWCVDKYCAYGQKCAITTFYKQSRKGVKAVIIGTCVDRHPVSGGGQHYHHDDHDNGGHGWGKGDGNSGGHHDGDKGGDDGWGKGGGNGWGKGGGNSGGHHDGDKGGGNGWGKGGGNGWGKGGGNGWGKGGGGDDGKDGDMGVHSRGRRNGRR